MEATRAEISRLCAKLRVLHSAYENAPNDGTLEALQLEIVKVNGQIRALRDWEKTNEASRPFSFAEW